MDSATKHWRVYLVVVTSPVCLISFTNFVLFIDSDSLHPAVQIFSSTRCINCKKKKEKHIDLLSKSSSYLLSFVKMEIRCFFFSWLKTLERYCRFVRCEFRYRKKKLKERERLIDPMDKIKLIQWCNMRKYCFVFKTILFSNSLMTWVSRRISSFLTWLCFIYFT
jgi:hypothetical protein